MAPSKSTGSSSTKGSSRKRNAADAASGTSMTLRPRARPAGETADTDATGGSRPRKERKSPRKREQPGDQASERPSKRRKTASGVDVSQHGESGGAQGSSRSVEASGRRPMGGDGTSFCEGQPGAADTALSGLASPRQAQKENHDSQATQTSGDLESLPRPVKPEDLRRRALGVLDPEIKAPDMPDDVKAWAKSVSAVTPLTGLTRARQLKANDEDQLEALGKMSGQDAYRLVCAVSSGGGSGQWFAGFPFNPLHSATLEEYCQSQDVLQPLPSPDDLAAGLARISALYPHIVQDALDFCAETGSSTIQIVPFSPRYFVYPTMRLVDDKFDKKETGKSYRMLRESDTPSSLDVAWRFPSFLANGGFEPSSSKASTIAASANGHSLGYPSVVTQYLASILRPILLAFFNDIMTREKSRGKWYPHFEYEERVRIHAVDQNPGCSTEEWDSMFAAAFGELALRPQAGSGYQRVDSPLPGTKTVVPCYKKAIATMRTGLGALFKEHHRACYKPVVAADNSYRKLADKISQIVQDAANPQVPESTHCSSRQISAGDDASAPYLLSAQEFESFVGPFKAAEAVYAKADSPRPPNWDEFRSILKRTAYAFGNDVQLSPDIARAAKDRRLQEMALDLISSLEDDEADTRKALRRTFEHTRNPMLSDIQAELDSEQAGVTGLHGMPAEWDAWDIVIYLGLEDLQDEQTRYYAQSRQRDQAHRRDVKDGTFLFPEAHAARSTCLFPVLSGYRRKGDALLDNRPRFHQLHAVARFYSQAFAQDGSGAEARSMLLADAPGLGKALTAQMIAALWRYYQERVRSEPDYRVPVMRGPPGSTQGDRGQPLLFLGRPFLDTPITAPVLFVTKVSTVTGHYKDFQDLMCPERFNIYRSPPRPTGDDAPRQLWWKRYDEANLEGSEAAHGVTPIMMMTWGEFVDESKGKTRTKRSLFDTRSKYAFVFFDEMHENRHPWSEGYVAAKGCSSLASSAWGLTATPIFNSPLDVLNILRACGLDTATSPSGSGPVAPPEKASAATASIAKADTRRDVTFSSWYRDTHSEFQAVTAVCRRMETERQNIQRALKLEKRRNGRTVTRARAGSVTQSAGAHGFDQAQNLPPDAIASLSELDPTASEELQRRWAEMQRTVKHEVLYQLLVWMQARMIRRVPETLLPFSGDSIIPSIEQHRHRIEVELSSFERRVYKRLRRARSGTLPAGFSNELRQCLIDPYVAVRGTHQWDAQPSTKVCKAAELAREILEADKDLPDGEKRKIVIYLKWAGLINIVATHLRRLDVPVAITSGSTPVEQRDKIVNGFMSDESHPSVNCLCFDPESQQWQRYPSVPSRVLIITDAMGAGVNLQRASVLINLDAPWSYADYLQIIGRVVRIGQKREVQIFDLVAKGTIDEYLAHIRKLKRTWTEMATKGASALAPYISSMEEAHSARSSDREDVGEDPDGGDIGIDLSAKASTVAASEQAGLPLRDRFDNEVDADFGICPACHTALWTRKEADADPDGLIEYGTCRSIACTWPSPEHPDHLRAYQPWDSTDPRSQDPAMGKGDAQPSSRRTQRSIAPSTGDVRGLRSLARSFPMLDQAWRHSAARQRILRVQERLTSEGRHIATIALGSAADDEYTLTAKLTQSAIWRFFQHADPDFDSTDLRIRDLYDPSSWAAEDLTTQAAEWPVVPPFYMPECTPNLRDKLHRKQLRNHLVLFLHRCYTMRVAHEVEQFCFQFILSSLSKDEHGKVDDEQLIAALSLLTTNGEFSFEAARHCRTSVLASTLEELWDRLGELGLDYPHEPTAWLTTSYTHRLAASSGVCDAGPDRDEASRHWHMPFPLAELADVPFGPFTARGESDEDGQGGNNRDDPKDDVDPEIDELEDDDD